MRTALFLIFSIAIAQCQTLRMGPLNTNAISQLGASNASAKPVWLKTSATNLGFYAMESSWGVEFSMTSTSLLARSAPWTGWDLNEIALSGTNVACVSPSGNDATARFGNPVLAWRTISNAVTALNALSGEKLLYLGCGDFTNSTLVTCGPRFKIKGARRNLSKIWLTSLSAQIQYGDSNYWGDFSLEGTTTTAPIGSVSGEPARDVMLKNIDCIGLIDGIYAIGGEYDLSLGIDYSHRIVIVSCRFKSKWDTAYLEASQSLGPGLANMWYRYYDCLFWGENTSPPVAGSAGEVGNVKLVSSGVFGEFHNCVFISAGATNLETCLYVSGGAKALDNGNRFFLNTNSGPARSYVILNTNITATSVLVSQNSSITNAANGYAGNGTLLINSVKSETWP